MTIIRFVEFLDNFVSVHLKLIVKVHKCWVGYTILTQLCSLNTSLVAADMQEKERSASALPTRRVTNSKQRLDVGETVLNGSEVALEQPSRVVLWFL